MNSLGIQLAKLNQFNNRLRIVVRYLLWACFFGGQFSSAFADDRVTLFVDGMDLSQTFVGLVFTAQVRQVGYLSNSYLGAMLKRESVDWESVAWSGDVQSEVSLRTAKDTLAAKILKYGREGKQVDVVTHSMGSVVAYLALKDLASRTDRTTLVANLVTLSSPLGQSRSLVRHTDKMQAISPLGPGLPIDESADIISPERLRLSGKWLNAYVNDDPIGGPIFAHPPDRFVNRVIQNDRYKFVLSSSAGWREYVAAAGVADFVDGVITVHSIPYQDADTAKWIREVLSGAAVLPPVPFIDYGPQVDLVTGKWKLRHPHTLLSFIGDSPRVVTQLQEGEAVIADWIAIRTLRYLIHVVSEPSVAKFWNNVTEHGLMATVDNDVSLHRGDRVVILSYYGEGECRVWFKGKVYVADCPEEENLGEEISTEIWAHVTTASGVKGFLRDPDAVGMSKYD